MANDKHRVGVLSGLALLLSILALLVVGGDAGGNLRLRSLGLLVGSGRGDEQLTIDLC